MFPFGFVLQALMQSWYMQVFVVYNFFEFADNLGSMSQILYSIHANNMKRNLKKSMSIPITFLKLDEANLWFKASFLSNTSQERKM